MEGLLLASIHFPTVNPVSSLSTVIPLLGYIQQLAENSKGESSPSLLYVAQGRYLVESLKPEIRVWAQPEKRIPICVATSERFETVSVMRAWTNRASPSHPLPRPASPDRWME